MTGADARDRAALGRHIAAELREMAELASRSADVVSAAAAEFGTAVVDVLSAGNKLLLCGNGGSAADAQHLAAEYTVRFARERSSLPAIALTTDTSVLTAAGNDLGFDDVFARQVEGLGAPGDLLILHSTSGNSANLSKAAAAARRKRIKTVALLAKGGGSLKEEVDLAVIVPTDVTARAQELHLAIGHAVAEWVDRHFTEEGDAEG